MICDSFILAILIGVIEGVVLIKTLRNLAVNNSSIINTNKSRAPKILYRILVAITIFQLAIFLIAVLQSNERATISSTYCAFISYGLAQYFKFFKASNVSQNKKVSKFIIYSLLIFSYLGSSGSILGIFIFIIGNIWCRKNLNTNNIINNIPTSITSPEDFNCFNNTREVKIEDNNIFSTENFGKFNIFTRNQKEALSSPQNEAMLFDNSNNLNFCRYCGQKVPSDSIFCYRCGKQIGNKIPQNNHKILTDNIKSIKSIFNFKLAKFEGPYKDERLYKVSRIIIIIVLISVIGCYIFSEYYYKIIEWNFSSIFRQYDFYYALDPIFICAFILFALYLLGLFVHRKMIISKIKIYQPVLKSIIIVSLFLSSIIVCYIVYVFTTDKYLEYLKYDRAFADFSSEYHNESVAYLLDSNIVNVFVTNKYLEYLEQKRASEDFPSDDNNESIISLLESNVPTEYGSYISEDDNWKIIHVLSKEKYKDNYDIQCCIGACYFNLGHYDKAIDWFNAADHNGHPWAVYYRDQAMREQYDLYDRYVYM